MNQKLAAGSPRDTIFAVASGAGQAAITVVRLSGDCTATILFALIGGKLPAARRASLRNLRNTAGLLLDRALVLWMPGPASYTGEDSAELHLHGGRAVSASVCDALLALHARPADAGEFTRRAFLAGRMDLLEAEAIGQLAASETESQRVLALAALNGAAGQQARNWTARLTRCLAFAEAQIDFPDESQEEAGLSNTELDSLLAEIEEHLGLAVAGERVRNGLVFAITGAPNVGKSSLFNALAGRDIAIISALPGTTRDVLEAALDLGGVAVTLVDTAGLREANDPIEAEGIKRARAWAAAADLVIEVVEAGSPTPVPSHAASVVVSSKIDLAPPAPATIGVSVVTGAGLQTLTDLLCERARTLVWSAAPPILSRPRHVAALRDARDALRRAGGQALAELRAEELRLALQAFGRLMGKVDTEAVLDVVFGAFCIGK